MTITHSGFPIYLKCPLTWHTVYFNSHALLAQPATTLRCYAISTYMVRFHTWHLLASDLMRLEIYNTVKLRKKCLIWYHYLLAREQARGFFSWRAPQRSHIISLGVRNALKFMHSKTIAWQLGYRVKTVPKTKPTDGKQWLIKSLQSSLLHSRTNTIQKCLFETSYLYRYYTVFMKQSKQQLHSYL